MFGPEVRDVILRSGSKPVPSARLGVEVLEERILLHGAPAPVIHAAVVNPTVALQKGQGIVNAGMQQYGALENQLTSIMAQMNQLPSGTPRVPLAKRAEALINSFVAHEKARFVKFQALAKTVHGSTIFAQLKTFYRSLHQSFLSTTAQDAGIRFVTFTKFTFVPGTQSVSKTPRGIARRMAAPVRDTALAAGRLSVAADSVDNADQTLSALGVLLRILEKTIDSIALEGFQDDPCAAKFAVTSQLPNLQGLFDAIFVFAFLVASDDASSAATNQFLNAADEVRNHLNVAKDNANNALKHFASSTLIPAHPVV